MKTQKSQNGLGHILVVNKILSPLTVARVLVKAKQQKKRLGVLLEKSGLITDEELASALAQQFDLKNITKLTERKFSQQTLKVFNVEFALQHLIFPLSLKDGILSVAVADPTDLKQVHDFAAKNELEINPYVASRKEIHSAICKHYYGRDYVEPENKTILIVEDSTFDQTLYRDILIKQGYEVFTANDGMEGLKVAITKKPGVIVTDKEMPKLDGISMLRSIKAVPEICSIPVILVSGTMTDTEEAKVFDIGFFDYIAKPIKKTSFISRIERAFKHQSQ